MQNTEMLHEIFWKLLIFPFAFLFNTFCKFNLSIKINYNLLYSFFIFFLTSKNLLIKEKLDLIFQLCLDLIITYQSFFKLLISLN